MKTEFFKKPFTLISKSILAIVALSLAAGCGGGGDGGGSSVTPPPPRSPYITVASATPTDGQTDVDAQISEIKVTMSSEIDPSSFIKEGSALMALINARKAVAQANGMSITSIVDAAGAAVDMAKLTLAELAAGGYSVVGKYIVNDASGVAQIVEGKIKIVAYQFVPEADTGLSALDIFVEGGAAPYHFSGKDLIDSKYVNSKMFRVEKIATSGALTQAMGQITVSGRTITFRPVNFLEWGSNYQIVVKKDVGNTDDTQGIRELITSGSDPARTVETDKVFKFTTKTLPKAQISGVSPMGIDASPVGVIRATTNFKVDLSSMNQNTVKLTRVVKSSNLPDAVVTYEAVQYSLAYDAVQSQIIITPAGDLRYLQEYQVDILGGSNGIKGSMGAVQGRYLDEAKYSWTFTTSEAKVLSTSVTNTIPVDANGQATAFKVKLNFRPDPATVAAGVRLLGTTGAGQVVLPFTPTVANDEITLKPVNALQYGATYTIEVSPSLVSLPLRGTENQNEPVKVALATTVASQHTMDVRKLVSYVPSSGLDMSETSSIVLSFNFDIPDNVAADFNTGRSAIVVTQSSPGESTGAASATVTRTVNKRTVEIKPNSAWKFDSTVYVNFSFSPIEGASVTALNFSVHVVRSNTFTVTGKTPSSTTGVSLITEISVSMSHMLKPLTAAQTSTGSISSALRVYPQNCSASSSELSGRITYDTNRIYFIPSSHLKSWCGYKVVVNKDLVSNDGRNQGSEYSFTFETNGLSVQNVYVTYAYETLVDIDENIEVVFNYDLDWSQWSDSVELYNNTTRQRVSGSISVWNNRLTFNPSSALTYGSNYTLTLKSGSFGVEGDDGETMRGDYKVSFDTQNLPIKVDNYGPIGTVRTDTRFWIEFSKNVNSTGFPMVKGYLNGSQQSVTNDNLYTFGFKRDSALSTSYDYTVKFEWIYDRGYRDDSSFSWSVRTAATASALAARGKAATGDMTRILSSRARQYSQGFLPDVEFFDSCLTYKNCIGKLVSYNTKDYREQTIRGKAKVDIAPAAGNNNLAR